jgi:hypothetical protein
LGGGEWQCPATPVLRGTPKTESWFAGTFGKRQVRLYLQRADTTAVGVFYSTDDWKAISLGGHFFPEDKFALGMITDAETEPSIRSGLMGQLRGNKLVGTWKQDVAGSTVPVDLRQVPMPSCNGGGPWRLFSDRRWPIEFSYPADWHVEAGATDLTITCPDPQGMAYSNVGVSLSKTSRSEIPLRQCGQRWMFNSDDCKMKADSPFVSKAIVKTRNGITHYSGWVLENRIYCAVGGYMGQGDGEDEALQAGNTWIEVHGDNHAEILHRIEASMSMKL